MAQRFLKLMVGDALDSLLKTPNAMALCTLIAVRARGAKCEHGVKLEPGEALVGDHNTIGCSKRQYRTAKSTLTKAGIATFKATNKGTIAKLTDTRVYDISLFVGDTQGDTQGDKQPTPNRERENTEKFQEERERRARSAFPDDDEHREAYGILIGCPQLARLTKEHYLTALQFHRPPDLARAAKECVLAATGENRGVGNPFFYWKGYVSREAPKGEGSEFQKKSARTTPRVEEWRVGLDAMMQR